MPTKVVKAINNDGEKLGTQILSITR